MPLKSLITDSKDKYNARVDHTSGEKEGLVVATRPLKTYTNSIKFFTNENYGINMNIAVAFGATPDVVYQENIEWTTSNISGNKFIFNSAGGDGVTPYAGSACIDARTTINNNICQFVRTTNLTLTNYQAITGHIALTSVFGDIATTGINIYGWNTSTGTQVGTAVNIGNYIDGNLLTTWQQFTIPLTDMDLTGETIDALRITTIGTPSPNYFLDNIQIEETGTIPPIDFCVKPDLGKWLHVHEINVFIADNSYSSVLADSAVPNIPYDTLLGVAALTNGIVYQRKINNIIQFSYSSRQLSHFILIPGASIVSMGTGNAGAGTWLLLRITIVEPIILKSEDDDELCIIISDDLSGLDVFTISAGSKEEDRTNS